MEYDFETMVNDFETKSHNPAFYRNIHFYIGTFLEGEKENSNNPYNGIEYNSTTERTR